MDYNFYPLMQTRRGSIEKKENEIKTKLYKQFDKIINEITTDYCNMSCKGYKEE